MAGGRKGKYEHWLTEDGLLLLRAWARDGLSDEQLAKKMQISPSTLYEWKNRFPEFSKALARGKEPVDIEVENALHKRALGYTERIKKTIKVKRVEYDEETGRKKREYEELAEGFDEVHVPADVNAQKFWLVNRMPDKWRDKQPEQTGDGEDEINVVELAPIEEAE